VKPFAFVSAKDAWHAVALLAKHGPAVRIVAGGTDLLPELKSSAEKLDAIIDISQASDFTGIAVTGEGLRIGARATHSDIVRSPVVRELCPALADAVRTIGAVQTRNLGTIGGNLMNCVPSMDGGPVLLALDAWVTIAGPDGRQRLPLSDLFVGPRKTSLRFDQLLLDIVIPKDNLGKPAAFLKFGLRKGQALALVNVAAAFWIDRNANGFRDPRVALGAVAPTVMRAVRAEAFLQGATITPASMIEAGQIAAAEARPITDFRASAEYRRYLITVLTKRALQCAHARAEAQSREYSR
jgi:carbon-monoxide dehydrogenase medium subunit